MLVKDLLEKVSKDSIFTVSIWKDLYTKLTEAEELEDYDSFYLKSEVDNFTPLDHHINIIIK